MSRLRTAYKEFLIAIIPVIAIALMARLATGTFSLSEMFADKSQLEGLVIERSSDITTATGERHNLFVEFENRSDRAWQSDGPDEVFLLTKRGVADLLYVPESTWIDENKIKLFEKEVLPGERGHFRFTINTDIDPNTYAPKFALVDSDFKELRGVKPVTWKITVEDPRWGFEVVSQSDNPTIERGQTETLTARYKNTGNTTWHNYGEHPVKLAVAGESETEFYIDPRWPDEFHTAFLDQASVAPGEEGTFTFDIRAPETLGVERLTFVPEVFGLDDLDIPEVSYDVTMAETGEADNYEDKSHENQIEDTDTLRMTAVPVGHGDCYIIITPDEKVIMFDTGHPSRANVVLTELANLGIDKIDYLILSHSHWDHIGGAPYIMDVYPVENIYVNGEGYPYQTYVRLAEYFTDDGSQVNVVSRNDKIQVSDNIVIDILNPEDDLSGINEDDEAVNNNSLVARLSWEDKSILLTADVYAETTNELLEAEVNLDSDVLTLPHHGNNDFGDPGINFLDRVTPEIVIKSSDWGELETQTSLGLIEYLVSNNIEMVATASEGKIEISQGDDGMVMAADNLIWRK